jgi:hypothetical protein
MPPVDLTDDDRAALADLLRETIARDRFPLSPRIRELQAILAKLVPVPPAAAAPLPPQNAPGPGREAFPEAISMRADTGIPTQTPAKRGGRPRSKRQPPSV